MACIEDGASLDLDTYTLGIYESLAMTPAMRAVIKPDCSIAALRRQAIRDGLEPLRIGGARKVIAGVTSLEEVLRVAPIIELG